MTDETPYLIAHKVRGQPAFDIAIQMQVVPDEDPWWIIPTSGHRAYPYWDCALDKLGWVLDCYGGDDQMFKDVVREMPEGHPDHYSANDGGFDDPTRLDSLLSLIRPAKPPTPKLIRRSLQP